MVIDSPSAVVRQVVTKAEGGGGVVEVSAMATRMVSETVAVPSLTLRVNRIGVSAATSGAAKVVSSELASSRVMTSVELWDHE